MSLEEAVGVASTGDVWIFRGASFADFAIRTVTNAPVNHVGMVVALDDLPPLLWHAELGQRGWVRQLAGTIEREHEDRLMEVIQRYDGRAFPTTLGLAGQWAKGRVRRRPKESLEAIYCAELVATTYQYMGLLPSERPPSWYDPGRFWSGDGLELVAPFRLGGEIAVTVPDPVPDPA